jgi:hypothetical protein
VKGIEPSQLFPGSLHNIEVKELTTIAFYALQLLVVNNGHPSSIVGMVVESFGFVIVGSFGYRHFHETFSLCLFWTVFPH